MPTRKQRRRREKGRRHEYEEVYLDDEGNEISAEEYHALVGNGKRAEAAPDDAKQAKPITRGSRTIQPPSWRRVGRRTLIFGPLMFIVIMLLYKDLTLAQRAAITLQMLLIFIPFSYMMDTMTYRLWKRRTARAAGAASGKRR